MKKTLSKSTTLSKKMSSVVLATGSKELLLKSEMKGFAFLFKNKNRIKFMVTFYLINLKKDKHLIRRKEISLIDYNTNIQQYNEYQMDVNIFDTDKKGLVVECRTDN